MPAHLPATVTAFLTSAALAAAASTALEFAPDPGTSVTKTFRERTELTLQSSYRRLGESEDRGEGLEVRSERDLVLRDAYEVMAAGHPAQLARTFERVHGGTSVTSTRDGEGADSVETSLASALEGSRVRFEWDEHRGGFSAAFDRDAPGDELLLDGLEEDADLRGFLPPGSGEGAIVSPGDTWSVPVEALARVLRPGGDPALLPEAAADEGGGESLLDGSLCSVSTAAGRLDGEVVATFRGVERRDDREVAVIALEFAVDGRCDVRGRLEELVDALGIDAERYAGVRSADLVLGFEGDGELLWDPAARRVHGLELEGETELTFALTADREVRGELRDEELRMELAGRTEVSLSTR